MAEPLKCESGRWFPILFSYLVYFRGFDSYIKAFQTMYLYITVLHSESWWSCMWSWDMGNIVPDIILFSDSTEPLPEPILSTCKFRHGEAHFISTFKRFVEESSFTHLVSDFVIMLDNIWLPLTFAHVVFILKSPIVHTEYWYCLFFQCALLLRRWEKRR